MTAKIYGFVNNQNLLINTAVVNENDFEILEIIKEQCNATNYYLYNESNSHCLNPNYTIWHNDRFIDPQPYPSWNFVEEQNNWFPPVLPPSDAYDPENPVEYIWNEELLNWVKVSE